MRSKLLLLLFLAAGVSAAGALEFQRGQVKAVLNEKNGRLSLWGAADPVKPVWTPLFLATDPTTSKWKLQTGDKFAVLGDDPAFTTAVEATPTGAKATYTGKTVTAVLSYDFLMSADAAGVNGLRLTLTVTNVGETALKTAVRWVLDTNLGEKKDHFRLPSGEAVNTETKLEGSLPDFWISRPAADDAPGLLVMTAKGSTTPSRVVFANWKRLDDTPWDLVLKAGRDFNLLPYSFSDSAVASYYDAQDLAPGTSRQITVDLGLASAKTFAGARVGSANPVDDLIKANTTPGLSAVDQDLAGLDSLVAQIDAKLADPSRVSPEDLRLLTAALGLIEARQKALEASQP